MYSAQSLTRKSTKVSQTTPLYYAGIMRDLLVHSSDLFVDTSTQLLTYCMHKSTKPSKTIPNYYAGIMRDLPMLFGIPFCAGPTQIGI